MNHFFTYFLTMSFFLSFSQEQANWYFGNHCGINTQSFPPTILYNGKTGDSVIAQQEGCSAVSDHNGDLLFYTDGVNVFTKNHMIMENGNDLLGGHSSSNAALIVPKPQHPGKYFVFTTDEFQHYLQNGLRVSLVDVCENSGLGKVIEKNISLLPNAAEKISAVRHENGIDYWLAAHKYGSDSFFVFEITQHGVSAPIIQKIGSNHQVINIDPFVPQTALGCMKFSPDGSRLALAIGNSISSHAELFDFDNATGNISNPRMLAPPTTMATTCYYGVSFSPNSSTLFITDLTGKLWMYGSQTPIDSPTLLVHVHHALGGLQLTSQGILYMISGDRYLGAIFNPDSAMPIFQDSIVMMPPKSLSSGLCYFVDGDSYDGNQSSCTTGIDQNLLDNSATTNGFITYQLLTIDGRTISEKSETVDTRSLPPGIYIIALQQNNTTWYKKIMKIN